MACRHRGSISDYGQWRRVTPLLVVEDACQTLSQGTAITVLSNPLRRTNTDTQDLVIFLEEVVMVARTFQTPFLRRCNDYYVIYSMIYVMFSFTPDWIVVNKLRIFKELDDSSRLAHLENSTQGLTLMLRCNYPQSNT